MFEAKPITSFETCRVYKEWLNSQTANHHFHITDIKTARMSIRASYSQLYVKEVSGYESSGALFQFDCQSQISTDEKIYTSQLIGEKKWEFSYYYNQLYGSVLHLKSQIR